LYLRGLRQFIEVYTSKVLPYIFNKIKEAVDWLKQFDIESCIEPGRFFGIPADKN